jgi:hypothetical protein
VSARAGRRVELGRYRVPAGERALYAQRIDGRVAVVDVPIDHPDRVYLVERHVHSHADLRELTSAYLHHSHSAGRPAVLAERDVLQDLVDALARFSSTDPAPHMSHPEHRDDLTPAFLRRDPAWEEQKRRLWAMTPAERVEASRSGQLSLRLSLHWASRAPHEVPRLHGEFEFIAIRTPEVADAAEADSTSDRSAPPTPGSA